MGLNNPQGGLGYAAEFQSSALPFVTASVAPAVASGLLRVDFPKVSRFISVSNLASAGSKLRLGFTRNGMVTPNNNYFVIDGGQQSIFELRVTSIYLGGTSGSIEFSLCAGLTNIDAKQMPTLSGTLDSGDAGWLGVG